MDYGVFFPLSLVCMESSQCLRRPGLWLRTHVESHGIYLGRIARIKAVDSTAIEFIFRFVVPCGFELKG